MLAPRPAPVTLAATAPVTAVMVDVFSAVTETPVPAVTVEPVRRLPVSFATTWELPAPAPETATPVSATAAEAATETLSTVAVSLAVTDTPSDTVIVAPLTRACTLAAATFLTSVAPTATEPPCMEKASEAPTALAFRVLPSCAATLRRAICAPVPLTDNTLLST